LKETATQRGEKKGMTFFLGGGGKKKNKTPLLAIPDTSRATRKNAERKGRKTKKKKKTPGLCHNANRLAGQRGKPRDWAPGRHKGSKVPPTKGGQRKRSRKILLPGREPP